VGQVFDILNSLFQILLILVVELENYFLLFLQLKRPLIDSIVYIEDINIRQSIKPIILFLTEHQQQRLKQQI
jgi:hypothetical protein